VARGKVDVEAFVAHTRRVVDANATIRRRVARETGIDVHLPYDYAWDVHERWLRHYQPREKGSLLFVALNPGPYGATQTGVPFTDVRTARSRLPKLGFDEEIPGRAPKSLRDLLVLTYERSSLCVYTMIDHGWGGPEAFGADVCVFPYSPLLYVDRDRKPWNVTPEEARLRRRADLEEAFRANVRGLLDILAPRGAVAVGRHAGERLPAALPDGFPVVEVRHPAREPPKTWGRDVVKAIRARGLL